MISNTIEKFLLLIQHPAKGRFMTSDVYVNLGMAGALILDMVIAQKMIIEDKKIVLKVRKSTKDPIEAEVISAMHSMGKLPSVRRSVDKLSRKTGKFKKAFLARLAGKGFIRNEQKRILVFFTYNRHFLIDRRARNKLIIQLKECLLHQNKINNEEAVVLGLLEACRMQKVLSPDRNEMKIIEKQMREMLKENAVGTGIDEPVIIALSSVREAIAASAVSRRHTG